MKKYFLLVFYLLAVISVYASNGPVILFSDIESGPKNGWSTAEPNKGAAVTIWGNGFGNARGASYVTVNGINLTATTDYAVWGEYWPTQYLQKITFWLNSSIPDEAGTITVTVDGVTSNSIPFTVRAGNIYFITKTNPGGNGSFASPFEISTTNYNWVGNAAPGDIYYFRDNFVYDSKYNGGNSVLWIRPSEPSGTASLPIALLAFPGEKPLFSIPTYDVNFYNAFRISNNHIVISGFSVDSEYGVIYLEGDFHRFIGNDLIGLKNYYGAGTGMINSGDNDSHTGDGNIILGNAVHGGNSQKRLDHAIYLSGCADNTGCKVGWNHIYDNNFGRGPMIVVNHQQNRCSSSQVLDAHFIFNNIIDCTKQRSRGIGVYDLSYDAGEEEPEPTYVYNNILVNCGTYDGSNISEIGYAQALYHGAAGKARFYNNTLFNSGYTGIQIGSNSTGTEIRNNIFYMNPNFPGPTGNHYVIAQNPSVVLLSNNLYYGLGAYAPCNNCALDQNNVNNQDPIFVDTANLDLRLQPNSPAINSGTTNLVFEVSPPSYAPINRDINFVLRNGSTPTLGAYAFDSTILSIEDETAENILVKIYPNPAKDVVTILGIERLTSVRVYSILGSLEKEVHFSKHVNISELSSGMHFVVIQGDNKNVVKRLIIK